MGEAAEALLNGNVDSVTGEYLGDGNGYPRSYFDAKKYTGEGSVKMSVKRLTEYFKSYSIKELQGGGLNIKLPGNGTVTVWWRKGKWTHSKNANKWFYFRNAPKEHANELIAQIEGLMGVTNTTKTDDEKLFGPGFKTAEQTLDIVLGETSDSFDANYREEVIHAIEMYALQFNRGIVEIPKDLPYQLTNNVQKAIDHILAKAEKIGTAKGADNATATMLKTIARELEQFL